MPHIRKSKKGRTQLRIPDAVSIDPEVDNPNKEFYPTVNQDHLESLNQTTMPKASVPPNMAPSSRSLPSVNADSKISPRKRLSRPLDLYNIPAASDAKVPKLSPNTDHLITENDVKLRGVQSMNQMKSLMNSPNTVRHCVPTQFPDINNNGVQYRSGQPGTHSATIQGPPIPLANVQGYSRMPSATYQGHTMPSSTTQGPQIPSATIQAPHMMPSSTIQAPARMPSATIQAPPRMPSATIQAHPRMPSATIQAHPRMPSATIQAPPRMPSATIHHRVPWPKLQPATTSAGYSLHAPSPGLEASASLPVSTLERDSSVNWKHYSMGQISYKPQPAAKPYGYQPNVSLNYTDYNLPPHLRPLQDQKSSGNANITAANMLANGHNNGFKMDPLKGSQTNWTWSGQNFEKKTFTKHTGVSQLNSTVTLNSRGREGDSSNGFGNDSKSWFTDSDDDALSLLFKEGACNGGLDWQRKNLCDTLAKGFMEELNKLRYENREAICDLSDKLTNVKPYVISGWISTTYLKALMQKSDLVNEMFDNALDSVGEIKPEIVEHCRKNTPAILARDLVFRVFTLGELNNGINLQRLSRNKMAAIRRCVKRTFPNADKFVWSNKCVPQIKTSLRTLFQHRVKKVQDFWVNAERDQQLNIEQCPGDMINTTAATQKLFQQDFDDYGDSFVEDTTPERLQDIMKDIKPSGKECLRSTQVAELEEEHFPDDSPYGLFRLCKIYLDNNLAIGDPSTHIKDCSLDLLALELRFFGADMTNRLGQDVSHVMVDSKDLSRVPGLKRERRTRQKKFHIVTEAWVRECMEEGNIVNERAFEPV